MSYSNRRFGWAPWAEHNCFVSEASLVRPGEQSVCADYGERMLRRFDFEEQLWVAKTGNDTQPCEAELAVDLASLDRLGPPSWEDDPQNWIGGMPPSPVRGWRLLADCGLEFVLRQDWIRCDVDHAYVVAATLDELEHALMHLPFAARITGRLGSAFEGGWEVRRVDDIGNAFSVGRYPREASARCVAKIFEERAHKQTYFVDVLGPPPRAVKGNWLVMRMDDNGQEFPVRSHLSRGSALLHMRMLEETPRHKQTYWVRQLVFERELIVGR